jgi:hypothetical protein
LLELLHIALIADMLSRSTYNANSNLRRTRSTNSIYRRPSSNSLIDPIAAKQHALVAATLAYERGHDKETVAQSEQQPSQLRRRRSNRTSGFEGQGSHFSDSKTSRRRPSKRLSDSADATSHHPRSRRSTVSSNVSAQDFAPRTVLSRMPSVHTIHEDDERFRQHRSSISVHKLRKAKSMYSPSSHVRAGSIDDISFDPPHRQPPLPPPLEETVTSISELNIEDTVDITTSIPMPLTRVNLENIPERPTEIKAHCSRDVHSHNIRHRASLMLTPFKKRREKTLPTTPPPAAMPDFATSYASVVRQPGPVATTTPRHERRRASSEAKKIGSITARIRSVFRRTSGPLHELPVQHVNASRAYFGSTFPVAEPQKAAINLTKQQIREKNVTSHVSLQPPVLDGRGTSPSHSAFSMGSKSRVTSWADSTIAGTIIEGDGEQYLDSIKEEPQGRRGTLKNENKHSSLNLFRRMRRASRADMQSSDHGEHILEPSTSRQSKRAKSRSSQHQSRRTSGARETLPSQIRKTTTLTKTSIRAVSPELDDATLEMSSTRQGRACAATPDFSSSDHSAQSTVRKRNKLQKAHSLSIAAPPPTAEQIAERMRRSDERWQEPIDGCRSLFYPRSPKRASPSRHSRQTSTHLDDQAEQKPSSEVVFTNTRERPPSRSADMISPSIYSDNDDCQNLDNIHELSAMPPTPLEYDPGTAVIIKSHQVAKYSVGSPKKPKCGQMRKTSKDWRNWLQSEVQDLESPPPDDLKLSTEFVKRNPDSGHHKELAQINDDTEDETVLPSSELDSTEDLTSEQRTLPSLEWRPNQPPRIMQHTSDISIPSTSTSAQSRFQAHSSFNEADEEDLATNFARPADQRSTSSRPHKLSYRYAQEDRPLNCLHGIDERSSLINRPSSRMNDRFPHISTSRPQSRTSGRSSTPAQSLHSRSSRPAIVQRIQSASEKNKENNAPSPTQSLPAKPTRPRPIIRRPMSTAALGRSQSSLAHCTTNESNASPAASLPPTPQPSLLPRPTQSSPRRPTSSLTHTVSADIAVRKIKHISMPSLETDPTLASILQGPYRDRASPRPLSIRKVTAYSRENSPLKENSAPITPKSEAPVTPTSGQRLAEQFLNARRFREEMRVMSPAEGSPMSALSGSEFSPAFL